MIDQIIELITSNRLVMIAIIILGVFVLFSLLKKLFKLAVMLFIVALAIVAYVYLTSENPRDRLNEMIDKGKETVIKAKEKAQDVSNEILDKVDEMKKDRDRNPEDSSSVK